MSAPLADTHEEVTAVTPRPWILGPVLLAALAAGSVTRPLFQHPNDVTVQFPASGRLRRCQLQKIPGYDGRS